MLRRGEDLPLVDEVDRAAQRQIRSQTASM
jgi:hypothetical protein